MGITSTSQPTELRLLAVRKVRSDFTYRAPIKLGGNGNVPPLRPMDWQPTER